MQSLTLLFSTRTIGDNKVRRRAIGVTQTVKGELVGDRILRVGTVVYSVLSNPDIPKYDTCFFLLQKVGYVYAILNYVVLSLHNESNRVKN